jgi:protein disulfide-isomerase
MRFSLSKTLLSLALLTPALAQDATIDKAVENAAPDTLSIQTAPAEAAIADDDSTIFNNIKVPPLREINGENFNDEVKSGYWFVKHYSPYCHHCQAILPVWQTLYEFYYVSKTSLYGGNC